MQLLRNCYAIAMQLLRNCYATVTQLLRNCYATGERSLYHAITFTNIDCVYFSCYWSGRTDISRAHTQTFRYVPLSHIEITKIVSKELNIEKGFNRVHA